MRRRYSMSHAEAMNHYPVHPERTARRSGAGFLNFDVTFQIWTNRPAMAKTIRMQESRERRQDDWTACVKLTGNEGY